MRINRRGIANTVAAESCIPMLELNWRLAMRTEIETLIDKLLLLYSIEQGNKYGLMEGTFKLQKVPFASELSMNEQGTKGFNYTFFKYWYGPMSKEIYVDGTALHVG